MGTQKLSRNKIKEDQLYRLIVSSLRASLKKEGITFEEAAKTLEFNPSTVRGYLSLVALEGAMSLKFLLSFLCKYGGDMFLTALCSKLGGVFIPLNNRRVELPVEERLISVGEEVGDIFKKTGEALKKFKTGEVIDKKLVEGLHKEFFEAIEAIAYLHFDVTEHLHKEFNIKVYEPIQKTKK